jgi:methionyl-tRNA formyltransferase
VSQSKLSRARLVTDRGRGGRGRPPSGARPLPDDTAPPGLTRDADRLLLGTAAGALELLEVQPPGGRPMDGAAYLRGRDL